MHDYFQKKKKEKEENVQTWPRTAAGGL